MPLLILKREFSYFGCLRSLRVEIDGRSELRLKCGEEKSIELPVGYHTVITRMDWCESNPVVIHVTSNDPKRLILDAKPLLLCLLGIIIPPFQIFKVRESSDQSSPAHSAMVL